MNAMKVTMKMASSTMQSNYLFKIISNTFQNLFKILFLSKFNYELSKHEQSIRWTIQE